MDDPSAAPFYSPQNVTVVKGVNNTVTWVNNDDVPHTVTATDGSFNSGNLNAGQTWAYTFVHGPRDLHLLLLIPLLDEGDYHRPRGPQLKVERLSDAG